MSGTHRIGTVFARDQARHLPQFLEVNMKVAQYRTVKYLAPLLLALFGALAWSTAQTAAPGQPPAVGEMDANHDGRVSLKTCDPAVIRS